MRILYTLILLMGLTHNVNSQIQTGGSGGRPDGDGGPKDIPEVQLMLMLHRYEKIMLKVNRQWKNCGGKSLQSFEELYIQLVWPDFSSAFGPLCPFPTRASCFFTPKIRNEIGLFFNQKHIESFLKFKEENATPLPMIEYFRKRSSEE